MGPSCPQEPGAVRDAARVSEDCLNLNIWCPAGAFGAPVLVFLHGGGFVSGGNSAYNGSQLAAHHGLCVVVPNYRLGALGFLAIPGERGASGLFGIQDQQCALRWVSSQIGHFGGNRSRVLLGGQSAGAGSVVMHLVSPFSAGLFSSAVVESGVSLLLPPPPARRRPTPIPQGFYTQDAAAGSAFAAALLAGLNCTSLRCMEEASAAEVVAASSRITTAFGHACKALNIGMADFTPWIRAM